MNILPKKRWHVRTKENIARVRRDEAKAAEEDKAKEDRIKLADSESRLQLLKKLAKEKYGNENENLADETDDIDFQKTEGSIIEENGHINFFANIEDGNKDYKKANAEHEKEKKEIQEKYEKQIGYLTYLGQDTNEALGKQSWYNVVPERDKESSVEINLKTKVLNDPLSIMKKYLDFKKDIKFKTNSNTTLAIKEFIPESKTITEKHASEICKVLDVESKKRKRKRSRSDSSDNEKIKKKSKKKHKHKRKFTHASNSDISEDEEEEKIRKQRKLEILRAERLKREREERAKAEKLLAKIRGEPEPKEIEKPKTIPVVKQKYNSQFNPELAKQNYDNYKDRK